MLDSARYFFAFLTVATLPFALAYWYVIHPFVGFWRATGPWVAYAVMLVVLALNVAIAWNWRDLLFAASYPVGPVHWIIAAALYVTAAAIQIKCQRHLKFRILVGLPELSPARHASKLLQTGIYSHIRHPRYVSISFGMLAAAIFCNYQSLWIITVLMFPALAGIVLLEERELRDRFGEAYIDYSRRVPRFLPRSR